MTYFFDGSKEAFLTAFLLAYCDERAIVTAGSCQLALGQECVFVRADEEKARLSRDLMSEVRRSRLEKLQTDVRDTDLSDDEIRAEVEYVRQTMYMERRGDEDYSGYKSVD